MSSNFISSEQKYVPGNRKQTHVHSPVHFIFYVRTVPCKN